MLPARIAGAVFVCGICLFLRAQVGLVTAQQSSAILDVKPVTLPGYDTSPRIALFAPTRTEYDRVATDRTFVMERLTYRSDGLDVYAYLYRPGDPPGNRQLPVVVFNRGSYVRDDFSFELLLLANRLGRQGYLVIAPMLRGSGGSRGHDEMGGADLHDIFNIVPVIKAIPYADPARVFLYGESRGGIMSLLAAKENFPARAVAVWGAITDLGVYLEANPALRKLSATIIPGFEKDEQALLRERSAIHWPERIRLPVLIMNGAADTDVPPSHAMQLAAALHRLGKPHELKIFFGEGHIAAGRAPERDEDAVRWFRRFDVTP